MQQHKMGAGSQSYPSSQAADKQQVVNASSSAVTVCVCDSLYVCVCVSKSEQSQAKQMPEHVNEAKAGGDTSSRANSTGSKESVRDRERKRGRE